MSRDFLADNESNSSLGRDYLQEPEQESLLEAASMAIPRIGEDLFRKGYEALQNSPQYLEKAKSEIPAMFNPLEFHPINRGKQLLAGLAEGGHQLLNSPHDLANYAANRLNLIPKSFAENIPYQRDISNDINQLLGSPQAPGEAFVRGAGRNAQSLIPASKAASLLNPLELIATKKGIKNHLLDTHDFLENRASNAFKHVSSEVNARGANQIPIENHITPNFFEGMNQYFPNTRASAELINQAKTGDYNALRKLQSDLYTRAKKNLGSDMEADRLKGAEMLEKRNDINEAISNHLQNLGHYDLNETLNQARKDWSTLQNTYYNENISNALVKMFDKDVRKIPKNLVNLLSEESIPMENLRNFHPGIDKKLKGYKASQNVLQKLYKYGTPLSIGGITGYEIGKHK